MSKQSTLKLSSRYWTLLSHLVMSGQGSSGGQTIPEMYSKVAPAHLQAQDAGNAAEVNRLKVTVNKAVKLLEERGLASKSSEKRRKLGGQNRPASVFHPTNEALKLKFPDEVAEKWDISEKQVRGKAIAHVSTLSGAPAETELISSDEDVVDLSASAEDLDDLDWSPDGDDFSETVDETFGEESDDVVHQPVLVEKSVCITPSELSLGNIELRAQAAITCLEQADQRSALRHLTAILAEAKI